LKIVLQGYYGWGNLGDDILMLTALYLTRKEFPNAEIFICTESKQPNYIKKYIGELPIVSSSSSLNVDLIIHGGGGVYFDFQNGNAKHWFINRIIRIIGFKRFRKIYNEFKLWRGKGSVVATLRVGLGIGVGTFTTSSKKFYSSIITLSDFSLLFVRDDASYKLAKKYGFKYPILKSTDIAFCTNGWLKLLKLTPVKKGNKVGFILRDWAIDNHLHIHSALRVAERLKAAGLEIEFYSFYSNQDEWYIENVKSLYPIFIWNPSQEKLCDYLQNLMSVSCIISSRAHGAIVAASLGIPGICLEIEPKLRAIAAMLLNSSALIEKPFNVDVIVNEALRRIHKSDDYITAVKKDVAENKKVLNASFSHFQSFFYSKVYQ